MEIKSLIINIWIIIIIISIIKANSQKYENLKNNVKKIEEFKNNQANEQKHGSDYEHKSDGNTEENNNKINGKKGNDVTEEQHNYTYDESEPQNSKEEDSYEDYSEKSNIDDKVVEQKDDYDNENGTDGHSKSEPGSQVMSDGTTGQFEKGTEHSSSPKMTSDETSDENEQGTDIAGSDEQSSEETSDENDQETYLTGSEKLSSEETSDENEQGTDIAGSDEQSSEDSIHKSSDSENNFSSVTDETEKSEAEIDIIFGNFYRYGDMERKLPEDYTQFTNLFCRISNNVIKDLKKFFDSYYIDGEILKSFQNQLISGHIKLVDMYCKPIDPKAVPYVEKQIKQINNKWVVFKSIRDQLMDFLASASHDKTKINFQQFMCFFSQYVSKLSAVFPKDNGGQTASFIYHQIYFDSAFNILANYNYKASDKCSFDSQLSVHPRDLGRPQSVQLALIRAIERLTKTIIK